MILQELTLSGLAKLSSNFRSLASSFFFLFLRLCTVLFSIFLKSCLGVFFDLFFCKAYKRVDVSICLFLMSSYRLKA